MKNNCGGYRRRRPIAPGPGGGHGAGRPGGVGSSNASEGGAEAFARAVCCRPTPPLSPEDTPGASDVTRRTPATGVLDIQGF